MHGVLARRMISAVFDSNLLISAFLSRGNPASVSNELLRFARRGDVHLHLSGDIVDETLATLIGSWRAQARYGYTTHMALQFCEGLISACTIIDDPPAIPGAVPRDPDDDKIIACAIAARAQYIVTRDRDLLSLVAYGDITIASPERFVAVVRAEYGRLPD